MLSDIRKYARELQRAVRNHKYELAPQGLYLSEARVFVGGHFGVSVNGSPMEWSHNIVPNEGLNHMLDVTLHNQAQVATWYVAPFSGNVTPASTWTAANFTSNSTETTGYDESARVDWVEGAVASQSVSNTASKARFTINASATIYGAGLLSVSTKSATTGKLFAASRFATSRAVVDDDLLDLAYTVTLTSS